MWGEYTHKPFTHIMILTNIAHFCQNLATRKFAKFVSIKLMD